MGSIILKGLNNILKAFFRGSQVPLKWLVMIILVLTFDSQYFFSASEPFQNYLSNIILIK